MPSHCPTKKKVEQIMTSSDNGASLSCKLGHIDKQTRVGTGSYTSETLRPRSSVHLNVVRLTLLRSCAPNHQHFEIIRKLS